MTEKPSSETVTDPDVHLPALDGLRGIAVLIVLISHLANAGMLPSVLGQGFGGRGVALFYGLSGLLMARLYLHKGFTHVEVCDYAFRRGARVLPFYYACIVLGIVMLILGISPYEQDSWQDIARAALLYHGTGVLWSIPVELQFYVVFLGIWLCASRGKLVIALVALLCVQAAMMLATLVTVGYGPLMSNTFNLLFWLHFFLFGITLGVLSKNKRFMRFSGTKTKTVRLFTIVLLSLIILMPPSIREAGGIPRRPAFIDPLSAGYILVLMTATLLNLGILHVFSSRLLRWVGKISFSAYLLHMPVIVLVQNSWASPPSLMQAIVVVIVTFGVSALSMRWIELGAQRAILNRCRR